MKSLRYLLFPITIVYWCVTTLRNKLFDWGIFNTYQIPGKSITIGNLSMGGTGKSPHTTYLIDHLLNSSKNVSTLSRGYGRETKGLLEATQESKHNEIGDEPLMYKNRYRNKINVVVAEDRKTGIIHIDNNHPENDIILLDDAFQHRKVKAGLSLLITEFNKPYFKDIIVPVGTLRECRSGVKRADAVIVSKCPESISIEEETEFRTKIKCKHVFFSSISYKDIEPVQTVKIGTPKNILLVTGIGNPKPLIEHLKKSFSVEHIGFNDHHNFTSSDIEKIHKKFDTFASEEKAIVTTEKDLMRLRNFNQIYSEKYPWFVQPISIKFKDQKIFNTLINTYVNKV